MEIDLCIMILIICALKPVLLEFSCSPNCRCTSRIKNWDQYEMGRCRTINDAADPTLGRLITKTKLGGQCTQEVTWYKHALPRELRDTDSVIIFYCKIPTNYSFSAILSSMEIRSSKELNVVGSMAFGNVSLNSGYFEDMFNLNKLTLENNDIRIIETDALKSLNNLTELTISHNPKLQLTDNLFKDLLNLELLNLEYNKLPSIESNFFKNLSKLRILNLRYNSLTSLDPTLFDSLEKLESIRLSHNSLESLPSMIFFKLRHLKYLYLDSNKFQELPLYLFRRNSNLKYITIDSNRYLTTLPKDIFSNLTNLKAVVAGNCKITDLSDELFKRSINLEEIGLSNNKISNLPRNIFKGLHVLQKLHLSMNEITFLSEEMFSDLSKLKELNLHYNKISNISVSSFSFLKNLKWLNLDNNQLTTLPTSMFSNLEQLEVLNLSYNRISVLPDDVFGLNVKLKHLHLNGNKLTKIALPLLRSVKDLQVIDLSYNQITYIEPDPFTLLADLEHVTLHHNQLEEIPLINGVHFRLRIFDISHNNISQIPKGSLPKRGRSEIDVNLSNNKINNIDLSVLSNYFMHPVFTVNLDLSSNNISEIDMDVEENHHKFVKKVMITLNHNPLNCNCKLWDFINYTKYNEDHQIFITFKTDDLYCALPNQLNDLPLTKVQPDMLTCPILSANSEMCSYEYRAWDNALIVNCINKNLTEAPMLDARSLNGSFSEIEIHLERNLLTTGPKENMGYENVTKLFLSSNVIQELNWIPSNIQVLQLHHNNMSWMSKEIVTRLNNSALAELTLGNNPWKCDCSAVSLNNFLIQNLKRINIDTVNITCRNSDKLLYQLHASELCAIGDNTALLVLVLVLAVLIILTLIVFLFYYRNEHRIKVWLFANNMCLNFVTEEEIDKNKLYDAFVSYSYKDEDFVLNELLPVLEEGQNPYKLCVHLRDWIAGEFITTQIVKSVDNSRRTLVVLSTNFLESVWGKMEFRTAHTQAMSDGRARVIVILYGEIDVNTDLDEELKAYIKTNTYVKWGEPWFWDKLRYALPHSCFRVKNRKTSKNNKMSKHELKMSETISTVPK